MTEPRISRDRDDIETWADEHDAVPVREENRIRLVRENDVTSDHERLDWETFHREVDDEDRVVTYYGEAEDRDSFEVSDRDTALDRVVSESDELDREGAEQRLIEGETITGTVTETTVVEETIVEKATLESDVVDRETIDRNVVDVELLGRECQSCDIAGEDADFDYMGTYGTDRYLTDDVPTESTDSHDDYPFDVTVEVREDWAVTIEERDRYTVETHITDVDVSETDRVEAHDLEAEVDVDTVHRQLLDSDIIDVDTDAREGETVDTESYDIESEFTEDDVLTTYLTSRRRLEREISDRSRLTTEVVEGELLDREVVGEDTVEAGLAEHDASTVETETEVESDTEIESDTDIETEEVRVLPDESDEGKRVVDETGEKVGEVIDVNDGVAFVDPHASLTEKVMSRLGFDEDEEYYRLREDRIDRITDDEIVVSTAEFDEERR
ncbi:hypothetical protein M0R89_20675 (plasmid) [Halorussus limi]|uniref:PRC-barrel domain-containing protein n=1 Tax=Halorussus limi TaxID=2938695 RepID=A0A8U0I0I5_9EURY|nr:hypothetical protein [Halorussus limi]UPV76885.1 hypothetical protein M0R89_20675 [Halorussus limi]